MPKTTTEPTGDYPHPAPVHEINLRATGARLLAEIGDHQRRTESLARESGVSTILMAHQAGDSMDEHSAPGVVTVQVLEGEIELSVEDDTRTLGAGVLVMLQPGVRHSHRAVQASVILLTVTGGAD
jgi:quercetin dioxygenase-like cupin family protein